MCALFECNVSPGKESDIQRNHCVRKTSFLHTFKKSFLLLCGGDKSKYIRRTCSAQAEEMLQVYMMLSRVRGGRATR